MVQADIDDVSEELYSRLKKKTMAKKKKKAMKKTKKKAKKKKKKQKYSSGFLKAIKELELAGVIKLKEKFLDIEFIIDKKYKSNGINHSQDTKKY